MGIAVDGQGNVYVADESNQVIRAISPAGVVTTLAGTNTPGYAEGTGVAAQFNNPMGLAVSTTGTVYVVDNSNYRIRGITPTGTTSLVAGVGTSGAANGAALTTADFNGPVGIALNTAGNLYVADRSNNMIREISGGNVSTFAGNGTAGLVNTASASAEFNNPSAVAVDTAGNVYVADTANDVIRKISAGTVSTLAGDGTPGLFDATGAAAEFNAPSALAVDSAGDVYVADSGNNVIRKITPAGVVTTYAGNGVAGATNGDPASAEFNYPSGLAIDANGYLYVADTGSNLIRKITP